MGLFLLLAAGLGIFAFQHRTMKYPGPESDKCPVPHDESQRIMAPIARALADKSFKPTAAQLAKARELSKRHLRCGTGSEYQIVQEMIYAYTGLPADKPLGTTVA